MQLQRLSLVQGLKLKMNPQLIQSLRLMELPIMDLRERIQQELEENPALEVIEDNSTVPLEDAEADKKEEFDYFESTSDPGHRSNSDEHQKFIEGVLTRPETLQQHLLWQLQLEPVDDELRAIAEMLIQNLNDDGFHKEKPELLFGVNIPARFNEAIQLVRLLEPVGTCTENYHEALKVQIEALPEMPPGIEKVLDNLDLVERGKYAALAKKTGINEDGIRVLCEEIKKLSPFPGRAFAPAEIRYVIPDIRVIRGRNEFIISLNDEAFPVLGVNRFFEKMGKQDDKAARDFARENIRNAKLFISHLKARNRTLLRVTAAVLEFQQRFFTEGPKFLVPLTLSDIAREIELHETTVSRTANGKYIQTEWGIFEIRYFFTNSISGMGSSGSGFSKEGVKETIKEIISGENRALSDQDISNILAQKGIALARRTVAKYRKELDVETSYRRKV
ncbi:MAG: RNA polymerase factor sigma-54 [Treponema sp.]|jgi:RNA polymerase sigma-54 factor|nr:RNA polymerase factor sigma-54 [Treponema sp.]